MTDWDRAGLPPAAVARLERARRSGVASSLLPVAGQAGLRASGLRFVGEVMGCIVEHIGWQGYGGCGVYFANTGIGGRLGAPPFASSGAGLAPPPTTGGGSGYTGFAPYVAALRAGWDGAIGRMLTECRAIGGDGVVGVSLTERHLGDGNREFVALGTAVAGNGGVRPQTPFATELGGQDVAKLLHSGWVPVAALVAVSVAIRHDDWSTLQAASMFAPNVEVTGFTELANFTRAEVRAELARQTRASGADGAVLSAPVRLEMHGIEVGEGHTDHVAEATVRATAVARVPGRGAPSSTARPLSILPLRRTERR